MDNKDLDLLRKCLPGKQQFKAAGESDEDKEAFNECGDRLLWLRDNGFIEIGFKALCTTEPHVLVWRWSHLRSHAMARHRQTWTDRCSPFHITLSRPSAVSACIRTKPQVLQTRSTHVAILPVDPAVPPDAPVGFSRDCVTSCSPNCPLSITSIPFLQAGHSGLTPTFSRKARILSSCSLLKLVMETPWPRIVKG
jgi:hypothetical protein